MFGLYVFMCNICISAHEGQNKASNPLELELGGGC